MILKCHILILKYNSDVKNAISRYCNAFRDNIMPYLVILVQQRDVEPLYT